MEVRALSRTYDGRRVVDIPGFDFQPNTRYAVIGANGSGKSTLARLLAGIIPPDPGGSVSGGGPVGYMPQKSLGFHLSVRRNLRLGAKDAQAGERAERLSAQLGLDALLKRDGGSLSGGETARLALARVLTGRWDTLILDEPTAAMDVSAALRAEECILEYQRSTGCTLVLITHALGQAERLGEQVLFLHEGRLLEHGPAEQVLHRPALPETRQFLRFGAFT